MPVRIKLSKPGEAVETRELLLAQELISIGRDTACTLYLADPLVSKTHARIECRGGACTIIDLHSTNATWLNGTKLQPDQPSPLKPGDRVKIAAFELEFLAFEAPLASLGTLGSEPGRVPGTNGQFSRYIEEWSHLRSQLINELESFDLGKLVLNHDQLRQRYEDLAEENRKLREQLAQQVARSEAESKVEADRPSQRGTLSEADRPSRREARIQDSLRIEGVTLREPAGRVEGGPQPTPIPPPSSIPSGPPEAGRAIRLIRILLDFVARLSSGQSSFLSEFVVRTTFQTGTGLPGRFQSGDDALHYFADPALTDEEFASRLSELETAAAQLILHVMGLLEGYRTCVDEGSRRLLAQVDPEPLRQELSDPNKTSTPWGMAYKVLPALLDVQVYRRIEQRLQDLQHEDRGVLEKRYFRPGFIRGYEGRVSSL